MTFPPCAPPNLAVTSPPVIDGTGPPRGPCALQTRRDASLKADVDGWRTKLCTCRGTEGLSATLWQRWMQGMRSDGAFRHACPGLGATA